MAKPILTDDLWAVIAPLLPVHRPSVAVADRVFPTAPR